MEIARESDLSCRICNARCDIVQKELRRTQEYTVVRCRECRTFQTVEHYEEVSPDYVNMSESDVTDAHIKMSRRHKHKAYSQCLDILSRHNGRLTDPAMLVDIGCGTGGFLEFLRMQGVSGCGYDSSLGQVAYCRGKGFDVERAVSVGQFLECKPEILESASVVTMWDVLEHIRDPYDYLTQVRKLLKEEGLLFVAVPSGGAQAWKKTVHKLARRGYSFSPWEHVFYFNRDSLRQIIEKSGYECLEVGSVVCYERALGIEEAIRRLVFKLLERFPAISPQLYAVARAR